MDTVSEKGRKGHADTNYIVKHYVILAERGRAAYRTVTGQGKNHDSTDYCLKLELDDLQ